MYHINESQQRHVDKYYPEISIYNKRERARERARDRESERQRVCERERERVREIEIKGE